MEPSGRITRYQHNADDPYNSANLSVYEVVSIYQDAGGVMWAGGFAQGLCKFDQHRIKFGHYHIRSFVISFFLDPDGTLWVGTVNGLYKYDRVAQQQIVYHSLGQRVGGSGNEPQLSLDIDEVRVVHRDRRGTLWLAIDGQGLIAFDPEHETYRQYAPDRANPNSLPVDTVRAIWEDGPGRLWLATWGGGLVRFDPEAGTFTPYASNATDSSSGLTSNYLYALYPDPVEKDILWIGTAKGGLVRFNVASGTATSFRHQPQDPTTLSNDDVVSVYRDRRGAIWMGTYGGGLNRLDAATGKVEHFTTNNSKVTDDIVFDILPDAEGKLWISTNGGGLLKLDPESREFVAYDTSDGIQDDEFTQGAALRSKAGELFFGGAGGFNAFFPADIKRDPYVPAVSVTSFKLFNQDVKLQRPIWTLPSLDVSYADSFSIQFAALAFAAPKKNRYAYKLEGFDDRFIEADRPLATYTKVPGGSYVFRIRASNADGVWNEQGVALTIAVAPPFWRTWIAYAIYMALLIGATYLLLQWQRQRIRRVQREGRLAIVENDLALTGAVQSGFLPDNDEIATTHVRVMGLYRAADACSGDWWWHVSLPDGRHIIMVGDVTGHGPGSAMVTAAVATAFRVLIDRNVHDVGQILELLNQEVLRVAKGKYHMTMATLEIDEMSGEWVFYSAGAPPMMSVDQAGKHRVHFCAGAPLGTDEDFHAGRTEGHLSRGDRLIVFTDGIPEIPVAKNKILGMRRLGQWFELTRNRSLRDAATMINANAQQTLGNQAQNDDWTFTLVEWN
jgi:streptogramin lyase